MMLLPKRNHNPIQFSGYFIGYSESEQRRIAAAKQWERQTRGDKKIAKGYGTSF